MDTYIYDIIHNHINLTSYNMWSFLNQKGSEGWELVTVYENAFIFKKRIFAPLVTITPEGKIE